MRTLLAAAFLFLTACTPRHTAPAVVAPAPVPPTPEQMQQYMMEAGKVGAEHKLLKQLSGTWKAETRFWMDPEGKPEVSKGRATGTMIYGGRFLAMSYKGTAMGQKFEGQSIMGFDNTQKKFFSTWIDSMNTSFMKSEGQADEAGKNIYLSSSFTCPMTREATEAEDVYTFIDKNHFRYQMFKVAGDKRIKNLEINYTRLK